jgi:MYXO-CTERM domain-containing protein
MHSRLLAIVAVSGLWVGCSGSEADKALDGYKQASLSSQADVKAWAGTASAPSVYVTANLGAFLSGLAGITGDPQDTTCPVQKKDSTTTRLTGGCTDKNGLEWFGSMEQKLEKEGSENGTITYKDFGYQETSNCSGKSGKVKLLFTGTSSVTGSETKKEFDLDIRMDTSGLDEDTCAERTSSGAWAYKGTYEGSTELTDLTGKRTWNGSGRIGNAELGVVEVETKAEVVDSSVCDSEASSGSTTIKSDGHTVVIQYDGATDCEEASTAMTSLDGAAAVELDGVSCSSVGGPALSAWGLGLLGAMGLIRRRARH